VAKSLKKSEALVDGAHSGNTIESTGSAHKLFLVGSKPKWHQKLKAAFDKAAVLKKGRLSN
jgi:hypothetical protein